jgi:hypothetical protein
LSRGRGGAQRACVFCGATPTTKEHIFPFWLREAVGGGGPTTHLRIDGRGRGPALGEALTYDHSWTAEDADVAVRVVCASCNNEWMNDLDHEVEPLIVPLIRNHDPSISDEQRTLLARWVTKIGLLLEHTRPVSDLTRRRAFVPLDAHREFRRTQLPPPETRIWMFRVHPPFIGTAWRTAPVPVAAYDSDAARAIRAPNGSLTTFAIGMLGFQLMYAPLTPQYHDLAERRTKLGEPFTRVLWPPTAPLDWPPPHALEQARFDVITHLSAR